MSNNREGVSFAGVCVAICLECKQHEKMSMKKTETFL